jgi:hypothetical protein
MIQINILSKEVGIPNENGDFTTYVEVEFIFDGYIKNITIPVFNPSTDEDILIGVTNRSITEFRIYQNEKNNIG